MPLLLNTAWGLVVSGAKPCTQHLLCACTSSWAGSVLANIRQFVPATAVQADTLLPAGDLEVLAFEVAFAAVLSSRFLRVMFVSGIAL
jgi:hypothetical protein